MVAWLPGCLVTGNKRVEFHSLVFVVLYRYDLRFGFPVSRLSRLKEKKFREGEGEGCGVGAGWKGGRGWVIHT